VQERGLVVLVVPLAVLVARQPPVPGQPQVSVLGLLAGLLVGFLAVHRAGLVRLHPK
jgi:hypothetical protein